MIKRRRIRFSTVVIAVLIIIIAVMTVYISHSMKCDAKKERCRRDYRLYSVASSCVGICNAYENINSDECHADVMRIYANADNIIRQLGETDMEAEVRETIVGDMNELKLLCTASLKTEASEAFTLEPIILERLRFFVDGDNTTAASIYARLVEVYDCDCLTAQYVQPSDGTQADRLTSEVMPSEKNDCKDLIAGLSGANTPQRIGKTAFSKPAYVFYCENAFATVGISGGVIRNYYYEGSRTSECCGGCVECAVDFVRSVLPKSSGIGSSLEVISTECENGRCRVTVSQKGVPLKYATVEICCDIGRVCYFDIATLLS